MLNYTCKWEITKHLIDDSADSYLIIDDSVQNKQYSKSIELVKRPFTLPPVTTIQSSKANSKLTKELHISLLTTIIFRNVRAKYAIIEPVLSEPNHLKMFENNI